MLAARTSERAAMSEPTEPKPKTVKIPGPNHPISVERNANRVVVTAAGRIVADTQKALTLREASYPPVQYIPRKDAARANGPRYILPLQGRLRVLQHSAGRCALHQRCLDV